MLKETLVGLCGVFIAFIVFDKLPPISIIYRLMVTSIPLIVTTFLILKIYNNNNNEYP